MARSKVLKQLDEIKRKTNEVAQVVEKVLEACDDIDGLRVQESFGAAFELILDRPCAVGLAFYHYQDNKVSSVIRVSTKGAFVPFKTAVANSDEGRQIIRDMMRMWREWPYTPKFNRATDLAINDVKSKTLFIKMTDGLPDPVNAAKADDWRSELGKCIEDANDEDGCGCDENECCARCC